jgi:hypothetical protein
MFKVFIPPFRWLSWVINRGISSREYHKICVRLSNPYLKCIDHLPPHAWNLGDPMFLAYLTRSHQWFPLSIWFFEKYPLSIFVLPKVKYVLVTRACPLLGEFLTTFIICVYHHFLDTFCLFIFFECSVTRGWNYSGKFSF